MPTKLLEGDHQELIFSWINDNKSQYPELLKLFAIPNGVKRSKRYGAKLKRQGLKTGVPDMLLPVARWGFHGLFIELKRPAGPGYGKGRLSTDQKKWIASLQDEGYAANTCFGWEDTVNMLIQYLDTTS